MTWYNAKPWLLFFTRYQLRHVNGPGSPKVYQKYQELKSAQLTFGQWHVEMISLFFPAGHSDPHALLETVEQDA